MNQNKPCKCCLSNPRKSKYAKYCFNCSEYICDVILQRTHKIDARYKKIFRTLFSKLQQLSGEEYFLPKQLKEIVEGEGK
jgi:hypothetical protein